MPSGADGDPYRPEEEATVTIGERLQADLKVAMREHDELRRDTLRMAISAVHNAEKTARRPLTDDELIGILTREVKTRRESIVAFEQAGRADLADKERREAELLMAYLPAALSPYELQALVADAIARSGAAGPRDMGKVMGLLTPQTRGRADGKVVSTLVTTELARLAGGG
jgi:uncharacterized protein YqeY